MGARDAWWACTWVGEEGRGGEEGCGSEGEGGGEG